MRVDPQVSVSCPPFGDCSDALWLSFDTLQVGVMGALSSPSRMTNGSRFQPQKSKGKRTTTLNGSTRKQISRFMLRSHQALSKRITRERGGEATKSKRHIVLLCRLMSVLFPSPSQPLTLKHDQDRHYANSARSTTQHHSPPRAASHCVWDHCASKGCAVAQ